MATKRYAKRMATGEYTVQRVDSDGITIGRRIIPRDALDPATRALCDQFRNLGVEILG